MLQVLLSGFSDDIDMIAFTDIHASGDSVLPGEYARFGLIIP